MDISVIDNSKINQTTGIKIGSNQALVKIVEFINLSCPYSRQWFEESFDLLKGYVSEDKVQRIIKLLDKEKEDLLSGNFMHHFITYDRPHKGLMEISELFASQNNWRSLPLEEVPIYARDVLNLHYQKDDATIASIVEEAAGANVRFVPTIFLNDQIFDESISVDELQNYIEAGLQK